MKQGKKREIISKMKSFPSMSGIAAKVLKVLDDPRSSVGQVEQLLKQDPSLTANLLKLTNSAYFGIPSKIGSVRHAITMMGWKKVTKLVMAACVNAITDRQIFRIRSAARYALGTLGGGFRNGGGPDAGTESCRKR